MKEEEPTLDKETDKMAPTYITSCSWSDFPTEGNGKVGFNPVEMGDCSDIQRHLAEIYGYVMRTKLNFTLPDRRECHYGIYSREYRQRI
jgi:hypothetical protein